MYETLPKAVAILIDNSATSIDGDFYPSRLQAQILTAIRYSQFLISENQYSQIAIGTLSNTESGFRASFTNSHQKIENALNNITSSGCINFLKGIKCAVLALHHCRSHEALRKKILAFVGSYDDITKKNATYVSSLLSEECIGLDLVILGNNIPNIKIFEEIVNSIPKELQSNFLNVIRSNTVLSDDVLSSSIGPGQNSKILLSEYAKNDPDLLTAINLSNSAAINQSPTISMMLQRHNTCNSQKIIEKNATVTTIQKPKIKKTISKAKHSKKSSVELYKQTESRVSSKNSKIDKSKDIDQK